ncbi:hypothetical protein E2C01_056561 [Portunus trituberculatus]|uniref:Uncharacterized protein n=1 Tax=Portunus trituberculatus TaxID=210409 RepID=A0A5B7GY20_PORTR|nr:hypothetical protein [Portunus trituberculatus]
MQNGNAALGVGLKAGWRVRKSPSLPLRQGPVLCWLGHSGGPTRCLLTGVVVMAGKTVLVPSANRVMIFPVDGKEGAGWWRNNRHGGETELRCGTLFTSRFCDAYRRCHWSVVVSKVQIAFPQESPVQATSRFTKQQCAYPV